MCLYCADVNHQEASFSGSGQHNVTVSLSKNYHSSFSKYHIDKSPVVVEQGEIYADNGGGSGPLYDVPSSGNQNIDYMLMGKSWTGNAGQGVTITFNFDSTFNGAETKKNYIRDSLEDWEEAANITFQEVTSGGDMTFTKEAANGQAYAGYAQLSGNPQIVSVDIVIVDGDWSVGSHKHTTIIHEIGHGLGLKHPHDSGGVGGAAPNSISNADWAVMSYASYNGHSQHIDRADYTEVGWLDAAAARYLYGDSTNTNLGDTIYTFSGYKVGAITDSGGANDVFALYQETTSQIIDLRDGGPGINAINKAGDFTGYVALGTSIEHAIGGSANDTINGSDSANYLYGSGDGSDLGDTIYGNGGNDVIMGGSDTADQTDGSDLLFGNDGDDLIFGNAGNDTLIGGSAETDGSETGSDTLYGGAGDDRIIGNGGNDWLIGGPGTDSLYGGMGNDKFLVGWNNGADLIIGFNAGDKIRILNNVNGTGIDDFSDLSGRMTSDANHTWVNLANSAGNGGGILIAWQTQVDASYFEFVDNLFA